MVVISREKAEELGAPVLATIRDYAQVSRKSRYIATVPGLAIEKFMEKSRLTVADFDLIEINEAFAAVSLVKNGVMQTLDQVVDGKVISYSMLLKLDDIMKISSELGIK